MNTLIRDMVFGIRLLWKDRGFALTVILTLTVCIAANTAIFTLVESVLLRPLPVPEADRILLMSNQYPNAGLEVSTNSGVPDYFDRLQGVTSFEEQALFNFRGQTVEINNAPERILGMAATPSLFRLLRVAPEIGRPFSEQDGEIGNEQKVILSHGLWKELFGERTTVLGEELRLAGRPFVITGIMPKNFLFVDPDVRLWIPLAFTEEQKSDNARHSNNWYNIGRLKPGAAADQVRAQVEAINAANMERFPQWKPLLINAGFFTRVESIQDMLVRDVRGTLYMLWGGAAFVLLIGAVNIANLVLARSGVRLKELATRLALGASRFRIARQLITESVLMTLLGGFFGLLLGMGILRSITAIGLDRLPRAVEIAMDAWVIVLTLGVSVLIGIALGLVGVSQLFGVNLSAVFHEEGRTGTVSRRARIARGGLIVAQIAFAFVLLIGAALLLASFRQLLNVKPGFESTGVVTASTSLPSARYADDPALRSFMQRALDAIRSVPGVLAAGATDSLPLSGSYSDSVILAEGYEMQPGESLISPRQIVASPGYFEAMSIPLLRGRYFNETDIASAPGAIIVDQRLAQKFWPNQDPIGKRMYPPSDPTDLLKIDERTRWFHVVGVVSEVRMEDLTGKGNQAGAYYFPYDQSLRRGFSFAVRTTTEVESIIPPLRAAIAAIDPELPLFEIRTMAELREFSLRSRRTAMLLALSFGAIALFLSAVGIYGVLAYLVAQRTREIGIRIALGSSSRSIFSLVLREGIVLVGTGLVLGFVGMMAIRGILESQVYGVQPLDPLLLTLVTAILGTVALIACVLPARRATRVDPVIVLSGA